MTTPSNKKYNTKLKYLKVFPFFIKLLTTQSYQPLKIKSQLLKRGNFFFFFIYKVANNFTAGAVKVTELFGSER